MKKIPTLFERVYENHKVVDILPNITPGCEEAFLHGTPTIKYDGSCCAIINGELYKRYDAKKGRKAPEGAIPCCEPDPITGHHPHWVKVNPDNPADKWFIYAYEISNTYGGPLSDGTYEAVGIHFQGNPYDFNWQDRLIPHGRNSVNVERTFDAIKKYLETAELEGLVFWLDGEPVCKIKRTDFGFEWPINRNDKDKTVVANLQPDHEVFMHSHLDDYTKKED